MNPEHQPHSPDSSSIRTEPEKNTLSGAAEATISDPLDPQHPPRSSRRRLGLLVVGALVLAGIGQGAWPVIDISAIAQLTQAVKLATDSLDQVTSAKQALLGQVAVLTGTWSDLTGDAYELGEQATGVVKTAKSLADIDTHLLARRNAETNAWPSNADVRTAYAGSPASVITQVLRAHQAGTSSWNAERAAWYDAQILLASTGEFLEAVETTASDQNSETTQGLGAQLDRQIAVSSAARDIAAHQLSIAAAGENRAAQLEHLEALHRARQLEQWLDVRAEINSSIDTVQASFDATGFDNSLYAPVLPSYGP